MCRMSIVLSLVAIVHGVQVQICENKIHKRLSPTNIKDHSYGRHCTHMHWSNHLLPTLSTGGRTFRRLNTFAAKGPQLSASHSHYEMSSWQCSIVGLCGWTVLCCAVLCCAVLRRRNKVPLPARSPNSTLPATNHHRPPPRHTYPLTFNWSAVCGRARGRKVARRLQQRLRCDQVQLSIDRSCNSSSRGRERGS